MAEDTATTTTTTTEAVEDTSTTTTTTVAEGSGAERPEREEKTEAEVQEELLQDARRDGLKNAAKDKANTAREQELDVNARDVAAKRSGKTEE
jgi:hypothetical protein